MAAFPLELWDVEAEAEEPVAWPLVADGPDVTSVVFPVALAEPVAVAEAVPAVTEAPVVAAAPAVAVPVTTTGRKKEARDSVMAVAATWVVVLSDCVIWQEREVVPASLQPYAA
jgi:hypothetical protein